MRAKVPSGTAKGVAVARAEDRGRAICDRAPVTLSGAAIHPLAVVARTTHTRRKRERQDLWQDVSSRLPYIGPVLLSRCTRTGTDVRTTT
jgi:hypothetical protein